MPRGKPWTESMLDVLKARYPEEGAEVLAEVLGVTEQAVRHRAMRLGIAYLYPGKAAHEARLFWTPEREQLLLERYPLEGPRKLAAELWKSPHAVIERARLLGVKSELHFERVKTSQQLLSSEKYVIGVYAIRHRDGRVYIGSSRNIGERWLRHLRDLRLGIHASPRLQKAWDTDGEVAFELVVLEVEKNVLAECRKLEQLWIAEKNSCHPDFGFNTLNSTSRKDDWK